MLQERGRPWSHATPGDAPANTKRDGHGLKRTSLIYTREGTAKDAPCARRVPRVRALIALALRGKRHPPGYSCLGPFGVEAGPHGSHRGRNLHLTLHV